jgi:DNA-binding transcriptional ArsR family regulator
MFALLRALGGETRLRLLNRLATGKASFAQLARDLGLAKSTVHHHALQLPTAGLLRLDLSSGRLELVDKLRAMAMPLREYLADRLAETGPERTS